VHWVGSARRAEIHAAFFARLEAFLRRIRSDVLRERTNFLALVRSLELLARIAKMKRSASGEQADGLTCDVFRCADLCDFCNALEFF
jgi:hypothetical protein